MPKINSLLATAELAKRLRVSVKAVRRWVKAGCPVATSQKSKHGRPTMLFDLKAVRLWLVASGNTTRAMLSAVPEAPAGGEQAAPVPANDKPPVEDHAAPSTFTGALDRARRSEDASFALWVKTLKSDPLSAAAYHARYIAAADSLCRLEKAKDEILTGEQTTIKTADAYEATAAILKAVRVDLEALPNATAPRLAGLTVPEIAAALREAIQDVLRHIYKGKQK